MKINNDTIVFKSIEEFFNKEESGAKSNTVRFLSFDDAKLLEQRKDKIKFINMNLEKLSDMLFNQKSWSIFLNSITDRAEIHNVDLQYITNSYAGDKGSFGHVLEIGLGCNGDYKNIVKFMNELEQNVLVTDIFKTKFIADENGSNVNADIHISVWGINR